MKELIIKSKDNSKIIMLVENGILIEKYEENEEKKRIEGNIYIGKVQNVLPGMQAAFVNIGENKNTFIHLKDILPKQDSTVITTSEDKNVNIKDVIKPGMPILVEVKRDSTVKKGARVSTHISIPGRFIVFMPNTPFITISQKINQTSEKERLMEIVKKLLPEDTGAIIRTSAENVNESEIKKDINRVIKIWNNICNESTEVIPKLVYKTGGILKKILIDLIDTDLDKIVVDTIEAKEKIEKVLEEIDGKESIKIEVNNEPINYELDKQLSKAENRKIWLNCGGFITIDKTEALTAIDVNSGKYIGDDTLEKTVFTVNKEASIEIAKQLKLRDIGGIIIIDYIDMKEEKNKEKIIEILNKELKKDRSKTQIQGFTKLNLLEMTRKHICSN